MHNQYIQNFIMMNQTINPLIVLKIRLIDIHIILRKKKIIIINRALLKIKKDK